MSGLNNTSKGEIAEIEGLKVALRGMQCINLKKTSLKILGIHFSHNKIIRTRKTF